MDIELREILDKVYANEMKPDEAQWKICVLFNVSNPVCRTFLAELKEAREDRDKAVNHGIQLTIGIDGLADISNIMSHSNSYKYFKNFLNKQDKEENTETIKLKDNGFGALENAIKKAKQDKEEQK